MNMWSWLSNVCTRSMQTVVVRWGLIAAALRKTSSTSAKSAIWLITGRLVRILFDSEGVKITNNMSCEVIHLPILTFTRLEMLLSCSACICSNMGAICSGGLRKSKKKTYLVGWLHDSSNPWFQSEDSNDYETSELMSPTHTEDWL